MSYKTDKNIECNKKAEILSEELPEFVCNYIKKALDSKSGYTQLNYTYKLKVFFTFLTTKGRFSNLSLKDFTIEHLSQLNFDDINDFLYWMKHDRIDELKTERNFKEEKSALSHDNTTKIIKTSTTLNYLACLSGLFDYYIYTGDISDNVIKKVMKAKQYKKEKDETVVRLIGDEDVRFLNNVMDGDCLSERQQIFHKKNCERDTAICCLLLNTGIRVSELVGLDIGDIDFEQTSISVIRKGNKIDKVFFSDETSEFLKDYISIRNEKYHPKTDETALFLNKDGTRLSVRSVELLVKKYSKSALPLKKDTITPHKLRATSASKTLAATNGNIYAVQKQLGHNSPLTTMVYLDNDDELKRSVRSSVKWFE